MRQQAWPEKSNPSNRLWHGGLLWAVSQLGVGRLQDVVQDRSRSGRNVCRYCLPTCRGKQVRTGLFTTGQSTVGIKILDYSHRLNSWLDGHIQVAELCPVVKWLVFKWWSVKKPDYGPKCPVFEWSTKSHDFTVWIPDTHTVWYSDSVAI